jgi:exosortase
MLDMASTTDRKVLRLPSRLALSVSLAMAACLLWAYWPAVDLMVRRWIVDAQYQYCFLVPFFAAALLWMRRDRLPAEDLRGSWWGLPVLAAALGLYLYGAFIFVRWCEAISLVPCLAGLCLLLGGWRLLGWAWPSLAFLAFMVPLPFRVEMAFADRLQAWSTLSSTYCLQTFGFPAFNEGTDILINEDRLKVVKACSGLSMLMTFFALSTAVAFLVKRPRWEKLVVVASAAPIALAANITRITSTAVLYQFVQNERVREAAHDLAGLMMMIVGLSLLGAELAFMSYLVVRPASAAQDKPFTKPVLPQNVPPRIVQHKPGGPKPNGPKAGGRRARTV